MTGFRLNPTGASPEPRPEGKGSILGSSDSRSVGLLKDLENECFLFHYLEAPSPKFSKEENSTFKDSRSCDQRLS